MSERPDSSEADLRRRPKAVRLAPEQSSSSKLSPAATPELKQAQAAAVELLPDPFATVPASPDADERAVAVAQKRGIFCRSVLSWAGLFWSALAGLASIAIGLWVTQLVDAAFAHSKTLGVLGLVLAGLAGLALLVIVGREIWAISRQRHIARLHADFAQAHAGDDRTAARQLVKDLAGLYAKRPETARARNDVLALRGEIIDGRDLIDIAERSVVVPLDAEAKAAVAKAAKRISVITTVAPRAIIDVAIVLIQAVRLVRQIAEIYGGRPGLVGFLQLARSVGAHLAITGGMAAGDTLVQQLVGHGLAAKLSARLGEGMLNGILTARIGLSAIAVCRPMPFVAVRAPTARSVVPFLFRSTKKGREDQAIDEDDSAAGAISSSLR